MWDLVGAVLLSTSVQILETQVVRSASTVALSAISPISSLLYSGNPTLALELEPLLIAAQPDQTALQATQRMLTNLKQAGYSFASQGVWIQSSQGVLFASHQPNKPLPAASLTKIATSLAALSHWGANHQFTTTVSTSGQIVGDTIKGDLIVQGGGDPFFVWEEAIALGNSLNRLGIRRVQGNLVVVGAFSMNFEEDRQLSASLLRQALNADNWSREVLAQYQAMPTGTAQPQVTISGSIRVLPSLSSAIASSDLPLISHASLPLWQLLKRMNIFSNNVMAEMLAQSVGGHRAVMQKAASLASVPVNEISLINGSGLGQQNRISPRAAVAMLIALHNLAQTQGLSIADLMPISDCNCGTIAGRNLPKGAIVKTGTLSDVSTLAGVLQTRDHGSIWFSIINRGEGDIDFFHEAQDQVLRSLTAKWGSAKGMATSPLMPYLSPIPWQDTNRDRLLLNR